MHAPIRFAARWPVRSMEIVHKMLGMPFRVEAWQAAVTAQTFYDLPPIGFEAPALVVALAIGGT